MARLMWWAALTIAISAASAAGTNTTSSTTSSTTADVNNTTTPTAQATTTSSMVTTAAPTCAFHCNTSLCGNNSTPPIIQHIFVTETFLPPRAGNPLVEAAGRPVATVNLSGRGITSIESGGLDCYAYLEGNGETDDGASQVSTHVNDISYIR
jgi:hypothetical protein